MRPILGVAIKDLRILLRDRFSLFWVLAFPLVFALFFGSLFGGDEDETSAMKIAVVDEAKTDASTALVDRLGESDALEVEVIEDLESARGTVRRGDRIAFLRITEDYAGSFSAFGGGDGDAAPLQIGVDPSRTAERGYLQGVVTQAVFAGMTEAFNDRDEMQAQIEHNRDEIEKATDLDPEQKESLLTLMNALDTFSAAADDVDMSMGEASGGAGIGDGLVETVEVTHDRAGRPRSAYEITFPAAIVWGLVGCATAFATTLVRERSSGTLLRLRVAPMSRAQLLAGKGLACFIAGLGVSVVLLSIGVVALGVRIADPVLLAVALVGASACFTGVMMAMSVMGKTEASVSGGSWIIMMPLAMLGGGMIPLIAMPPWMVTASNVSPFKWAIFAIEGGIWRDLTLAELAVPMAILGALALVFFAVGVVIYRRTVG